MKRYRQPPRNDMLHKRNFINQKEKRELEKRFKLEVGFLSDVRVEKCYGHYFIGDVNITNKLNIEQAIYC